jgi:hypothetical protein
VPQQLPPQLNTLTITDTTVFAIGSNTVTFSFRDASGHVGTATSIVTVLEHPVVSVVVAGMTTPAAGKRVVTLRLTNTGTGKAVDLSVVLSSVRLGGGGAVQVTSGFPMSIPLLAPGQSVDLQVAVNVPSPMPRFGLTETITMRDSTGTVITATVSQTIFP